MHITKIVYVGYIVPRFVLFHICFADVSILFICCMEEGHSAVMNEVKKQILHGWKCKHYFVVVEEVKTTYKSLYLFYFCNLPDISIYA